MVYRALGEGYAFKVEPLVFRWSEDSAENRFSYLWELTLEAYAGAPKSPRPSIFSPVTEAIRKASEYIAAGAGAHRGRAKRRHEHPIRVGGSS